MTWYSQAGQDTWVHDLIGDAGFFVDVGAHDGIVHSNTYALEQLGWIGICVEPNAGVYEELCRNRTCATSNLLASDISGSITFDGVRVAMSAERVDAAPLSFLLEQNDAPLSIDYMSIDVEGHELQVLAGMDFDRWHVRCITIEHNFYCDGQHRKNAIHEVLTGNGFDCYADDIVAPGYGEYESWWVHRDG